MTKFEVYKRGQGKIVRLGTAASLGLILVLGLYWLQVRVCNNFLPQTILGTNRLVWVALIELIAATLGAWGIFMAVNHPKPADFMILTESEMRKVSWPSKEEVLRSTKLVIAMTLSFATMLWVVDAGFLKLFEAMGVYSK